MIPIRDDAPRYTTPYINYFLLALNCVVFLFTWLSGPREAQQIVNIYGMIPAQTTGVPSWNPWRASDNRLRPHPHLHVPARFVDAPDLQYVGALHLRR